MTKVNSPLFSLLKININKDRWTSIAVTKSYYVNVMCILCKTLNWIYWIFSVAWHKIDIILKCHDVTTAYILKPLDLNLNAFTSITTWFFWFNIHCYAVEGNTEKRVDIKKKKKARDFKLEHTVSSESCFIALGVFLTW